MYNTETFKYLVKGQYKESRSSLESKVKFASMRFFHSLGENDYTHILVGFKICIMHQTSICIFQGKLRLEV